MYEKIRASKIAIERPKEDSEAWIHITVQKVIKSDNHETVNIIPRWQYHSFPLTKVAMDKYGYQNKMTGELFSNTGYEISEAITSIVVRELIGHFNASLQDNGDLILP